MQTFFVICFGVGVGYTIITFLLGHTLDFFDIGGGAGDSINVDHISPIKPIVIASFITTLGGCGMLFQMMNNHLSMYVVLLMAAFCATAVSFLLYRFIVVPLSRAQNTSTIEQHKLVGFDARVVLRIPQGSFGQITYSANGNTFTSPAKSVDGTEIFAGEPVEIVLIDKNTFFVKKSNKEATVCHLTMKQ